MMGNEENSGVVREPTFGEKAVGLSFNPGNNPLVDKIKRLYADIIDELVVSNPENSSSISEEKRKIVMIAIREAQTAQMWAVKAITWKD